MCCAYGSVANATTPCPICDVFKPVNRCPHVTGVCRNRVHHPRMDVIFLKNAEVQCFNGCGYCKWAVANPKSTIPLAQNPGWPGCCRPPVGPTECAMVQAADWHTVSLIHHISIPPEIKVVLDSMAPKSSPLSTNSTGRSSAATDHPQPTSTRNGGGTLNRPSKLAGGATPVTGRSRQGSVLGPFPPTSNPTSVSPTSPTLDHVQPRRHSDGDKRAPGGAHSNQSSPNSKQKDLESVTPRRKIAPRASLAGPKSPTTESNSINGHKRTTPSTSSNSPPGSKAGSSASRSPHLGSSTAALTSKKPVADIPSSASSSSGSSDGVGSSTDSTLTSDGGFTDYLSSGSEEELQRQAEAKAALVAQTQAEELEFKAARQQLQTVDLRPPKSWTSSLSGGPHSSGRPRVANPYQSTTAFVAAPARG